MRRTKDRQLRRFMESAGLRLPRWFQTAERILEEQRAIDDDEQGVPVSRRLRDRTASLVGTHPVIVASFFGLVIGAVVIRFLVGPEAIAGGVLPSFPSSPSGFLNELVSGYRTTPLGGPLTASPALAALSGVSWLLVRQHRDRPEGGAGRRPGAGRHPDVSRSGPADLPPERVGARGRGLRAVGADDVVLLAGQARPVGGARGPARRRRASRVRVRRDEPTDGRWRFAAGLGVTIAVLMAFAPGAALALVVLVVIEPLAGASRGRGLTLVAIATVAAAVLLFPFVPTLIAGGGAAFTSTIGTTDLSMLARLTPGGGPGTWVVALFLPIGAVVSFALVGAEFRARAIRAAVMAIAGLGLSWLSAAGWLPGASSNPLAYLALASVGMALLVAYGLASLFTGLGRESFGLRQVGSAMLALVLGVGLLFQSVAAMIGGWAVGGVEQIPAAWAVVEGSAKGDFRVLWVGGDDGTPFPAPGVMPRGRWRRARRRCGSGSRIGPAYRRSTRAGRWWVPAPTTSRMP